MENLLIRIRNRVYRLVRYESLCEFFHIPQCYKESLVEYHAVANRPFYRVGQPAVYFDLKDNRFHRYLYALLMFFDRAGYQVLLRKRWLFLGRLSLYSRMIMRLENMHLVDRPPVQACLRVYQSSGQAKVDQGIHLAEDYFTPAEGNTFHVPMTMHPDVYLLPLYHERSRKLSGEIRLFFAGNVDPVRYTSPLISKVFNKLSRVELVNTVIQAYPADVVIPRTRAECKPDQPVAIFMAVDPKAYLDVSAFMETMGKSDFYLAPPGVSMPLCHNIVEAMFMGTVPVLQYPELFEPQLEDNVNCIVFKDQEDLRRRVSEILAMPPSRVTELRQQSMTYYDQFLSPESVVRQIMERGKNLRTLCLLSEQGSVEMLRRRLSRKERD